MINVFLPRRSMLRTVLLCSLVTVMPLHAAQAQLFEDTLPADKRIKMLEYNPNDVYVIYTLYGYQTHIEFSPHEEIDTISVGDRSLWQIVPSGSRLFIRPMNENVSTNMTVITNKRAYQFDLKSGSGTLEKNSKLIYVARFSYPEEKPKPRIPDAPLPLASAPAMPMPTPAVAPAPDLPPVRFGPPTPPPASSAMPQPSDKMQPVPLRENYFYTFSGPDDQAPEQVYDDGRATFIRFKDMTNRLPQVFVIEPDGKQVQMAYTLRNGFIVIGTVADRFALVQDSGTVFLYNEQLAPAPAL